MAEELKTIHIDEHMKIITLDIKKTCTSTYQYKAFFKPPNSG
jgi:hypothetical protein